jgi:uncharacterized membrane protein
MAPPFIDHSTEIWNFFQERLLIRSLLQFRKVDAMRKTLVALAAVATLAISAAQPAHAQRALGAAVAGGIIGGAIVGGAIAATTPYPYGYAPGYYGPGPAYVGGPGGCFWQRQRFWDGFAWRFRRVWVCG